MNVTSTLVRFSGSTPQAATTDVSVRGVRMFGTRAWMVFRRDEVEWQRRSGGAPILRLDHLDALMNLPAAVPVPVASLSSRHRRMLDRLPSGAVERSKATVTRRAVPPLMPMLAVVRARQWLGGLEAASRFAPYCRRLVMVTELPDQLELALSQASFYGIGVALASGVSSRILVEPEPLTDWHPTPAWWWFIEDIYRQVRVEPWSS